MALKRAIKKHYIFVLLNFISIVLLNIWLFKSCTDVNSSITSLLLDFLVMVTCVYTLVRVVQSLGGNFKVLDMVTVYYASLFFLFSWYLKFLYLIWDFFWAKNYSLFDIAISGTVCFTLSINFTITERLNIKNLDKIESTE